MINNPWNTVDKFEKLIANFYGSKFGVAVDCCTHALELCLRYKKANQVTCPNETYISVPFTFIKLGLDWKFESQEWEDYYFIGNTNIIDAAVFWKEGGYIPCTLMCLSFQFQKHLNIGRGGMILTDSYEEYSALQKMAADGRSRNILWKDQNINSVGYHYYMTPESAQIGIDKFYAVKDLPPKTWTHKNYPFLPNMDVFKIET
jgi:dTDP-4-amino-4,6-dideoxygalactose transaminase